jgi:opacity protein-like surface antigen
MFKPYVGGGLGFAYVNVTNASSVQTGPGGIEHEIGGGQVINHFNSKTNASDYAFAGQFKLGLRAEVDKHWSAFAEYKYVYVDSTKFTFGNTNYPGTHAPTTNWQVNNDSMSFNTAVAGIEYSF